jgi:hypothetical protein
MLEVLRLEKRELSREIAALEAREKAILEWIEQDRRTELLRKCDERGS